VGKKHSYAAFAIEDIEDAKRGEPDVSLQPWAASRGLEYMGSSLPGAFSGVMPEWKDYVFNVSRGAFNPGRYGCVMHELAEIGLDGGGGPNMPGGYFAVHVNEKIGGLRGFLRREANLGPARPTESFATSSIWLPTTKVVVRIPEAALLPGVVIRSAERFPLMGNPKLDDGGLPGFRIAGTIIEEPLRLAIAGAARPLGTLGTAYAGLHATRGVVAVFCNGFVPPEQMDTLAAVALQIADGLVAVAAPMLAPLPFSTPLPPPAFDTWPPGMGKPDHVEADVLNRVAAELGMPQEDALAFHRSHPRCPVPGRAIGVVAGTLPGTATFGRVGFFAQGGLTGGSYRSGVMVPARAGATTPLGGFLDGESDLYVEVADGVAHAWPRARSHGALNAAATVAKAVPTFRRLGLADA
jgi:hypothetical protein